ncbi:hypothetical protein B0T26DRAFT_750031 [Lasiosphaeria miniovina]|uniref:Uncharacterized protein n=1 Tax=Lasiosphaeria miniovina TaxID=1954250 RepID=A0AA40E0P3_9PEZI|nr:uncharacterized protein B0T26DRAFT_750031 [Lasiosphaeria miniovina]KAK0722660.1 hypothetical protein B0T26DRAFT_750031 [Lasiosphaeria miniovina]
MTMEGALESDSNILLENEILSTIFATPPEQLEKYRSLAKAYLDYYRRDIGKFEHNDVLFLVRRLRDCPGTKRSEIQSDLINRRNTRLSDPDDASPVAGPAISQTLAGNLVNGMAKPEAYLSVAVRVMLALKLDVWEKGGLGIPWKETNSLEETVGKIFPFDKPEDGVPSMPIKNSKLRARYIRDYASVKLIWTNYLSEHLELKTDKVPKELKIFSEAANANVSHSDHDPASRSARVPTDAPIRRPVDRGYYDADFLWETLMTYRLLFPFQDQNWLEALIRRGGDDSPMDQRLTEPAIMKIPWDRRAYELPLRRCGELFKRYPRWAVRLQLIFEEADDPTPVTAMGMWFDRHKASRHAFGITVFAFSVTILFGLLSLGLGGAQIWIAYCTWHPSGNGICWTAPATGASGN